MKIGVVVDGVSEFASLSLLYPELQRLSGHQFLRPVKADIQPHATEGVIVNACLKQVRSQVARGADLVVVLIDRETRTETPSELATAVSANFARHLKPCHVEVVIKDRAYENWVIADVQALRACARRFEVSETTARAVQPDKADRVEALTLLKKAAVRKSYDKVRDSKTVLGRSSALTIAQHSRSFRRFLRVTRCPPYLEQSRRPA